MTDGKPNGEGEVLPVRAHDLPPDECERQLAALKAAIGEDRPGRTCPFCFFGYGWGHGRGCIRWLAREVIPIAPTTRRSDR